MRLISQWISVSIFIYFYFLCIILLSISFHLLHWSDSDLGRHHSTHTWDAESHFRLPLVFVSIIVFFSPGVVLIVRMSIRGTDTWCIGDPPTPPLPPPPLLLLPPPFPVSKRTKVRPSSFLEIYHSDLAASIPPLLIFSGIFEIFMLKWWNPFGTPFSVRHLFWRRVNAGAFSSPRQFSKRKSNKTNGEKNEGRFLAVTSRFSLPTMNVGIISKQS